MLSPVCFPRESLPPLRLPPYDGARCVCSVPFSRTITVPRAPSFDHKGRRETHGVVPRQEGRVLRRALDLDPRQASVTCLPHGLMASLRFGQVGSKPWARVKLEERA